jgi:hypothetical protein
VIKNPSETWRVFPPCIVYSGFSLCRILVYLELFMQDSGLVKVQFMQDSGLFKV